MSILDALSPYKLGAEIIVIGSLAAGAFYGAHQFLEHERDIGRAEVQARWDAQKVADKLAADKQEKDWREKYDAAINQGAENAKTLRTAATAAAASSDSLRNTIATLRNSLPSASAETARAYASAAAALLAKCEGEYRQLGQAAQGHSNDAATLSAAWPQNAPSKQP
jgi:hypothetical protein